MKSFNEVIDGKQVEICVYEDGEEVRISEVYAFYVFGIVFGEIDDSYFSKAVICATPSKIYMLYHVDLLKGNVGKIIYRNNTYFAMDEDSFYGFIAAYDLEPENLRILSQQLGQKQCELLGISTQPIVEENAAVDDLMRERRYEAVFRAVCFLLKEKQKKSAQDEKRWDEQRDAKRAAPPRSVFASNMHKFQCSSQTQPFPSLYDIQKFGLTGGLAVKLADCSLTTLVLRTAEFTVKGSCMVEKNGVKWAVVQCDRPGAALGVVKDAVEVK